MAKFDRWAADPDRTMYGVEVAHPNGERELVGFRCATRLDGGKTLLFQALRIAESVRGLGLGAFLERETFARESKCGAIRVRATTIAQGAPLIRKQKEKWTEICRCDLIVVPPVVKLKGQEVQLDLQLEQLSGDELWQQLSQDDALEALIPAHTVIVDWIPYEVTPASLQALEQSGVEFFVHRHHTKLSAVVLSTVSLRVAGPRHMVAVYTSSDASDLSLDIAKHFILSSAHAAHPTDLFHRQGDPLLDSTASWLGVKPSDLKNDWLGVVLHELPLVPVST